MKSRRIMMHRISVIIFLLATILGNAQTLNLQQVFLPPPAAQVRNIFEGVQGGASAFADVNGDSYPDVLITGRGNSIYLFAKLYINDGQGNFNELANTPFTELWNSAIAFADVDGDNDQDVLLTGLNLNNQRKSLLYLNNGIGGFSLAANTTFIPVDNGSIAFADVDGDLDEDVVITGQNNFNQYICALYKNDGTGAFSLQTGTSFIGVRYSSIAFADVDSDNDQDLIVTGDINYPGASISYLYLNDSTGVFTLQTGTPFTPVQESAITFIDFDGNQSPDVLITGLDTNLNLVSNLYANNGSGIFSLVAGTNFTPVYKGQVAVADVNKDGHADAFISGRASGSSILDISHIYLNNGDSTFTSMSNLPVDGVTKGDAIFTDIDGDNDPDLFLSGENQASNIFSSRLFLNDSAGIFYEAGGSILPGAYYGSLSSADVDGDNDMDVFVSGMSNTTNQISQSILYLNNGAGSFIASTDTVFMDLAASSSAFADVDSDSDLDLLVIGNNVGSHAKLYLNNGMGSYLESTNSGLTGAQSGSLAFADVDGDSDQDVIICGFNLGSSTANLYKNNGLGVFTVVPSTLIPNLVYGSVSFADVDGDSDQDVFITGQGLGASNFKAELYLNDSLGNYTLSTNQPFIGVYYSSAVFADIDGDGDQDIVCTGQSNSGFECTIYLNNGSGVFTKDLNNNLIGTVLGTLMAEDLDCDGDLDIFQTGIVYYGERLALVYENDSTGNFTLASNVDLRGVYGSAAVITDFTGNQFPDLFYTGMNNSGQPVAYLYRNQPCLPMSGTDTVVACNSYTWIDGNTYTTSNSTATYLLNATFGCDSLVTLNLTINSKADTAIVRNSNALFAQATNATFQWLDCGNGHAIIPGATNPLFIPSVVGSYAVEVSQIGCTDTSRCFVITSVAIEEYAETLNFNLYPNPNQGKFRIDFQKEYETVDITIVNLFGKTTQHIVLTKISEAEICLEGPAGMYFITTNADSLKKTFKVQKLP